jgi:outer membrane putative beta-barrel porin/alpha-amylase
VETEHTSPDASLPGGFYWHVQNLDLGEATVTASVGLKPRLGIEAVVPYRRVVTRIRFLDADRAPLDRPQGDIHHRNETLAGIGDPWLMLHRGWLAGAWSIAGRAGVTIPLGRTEPNPFALADLGLPHQHIQFGTGTWDPVLGAAAGRHWGATALTLTTLARLIAAENEHRYQAGNRYYANASVSHHAGPWGGSLGLDLLREEAERWDGRVRTEEGNLGRTDLLLAAGVDRRLGGAGSVFVTVKVPLVTRAEGSQVDYPLIFSFGFVH